jgi:thiol-disulfide isomerase/thioredoxin
MKKLLMLAVLLATIPFAHAAEINFLHKPWAEVLAEAQAQHKLVFVDAYTTWCGPCKWMSANTFTNPDVAAFFNANFINAKIDMEAGEGPELAKRYEVNAYPTLLFVDGSGKVVYSTVGSRKPEEFLQLGQDVAAGKVVTLADLTAKFDAGNHDRAFLYTYIMELARANKAVDAPLTIYRKSMEGPALLEKENWEIFSMFFSRHNTDIAQYFLAHLDEFEAKYGKEVVQNKGRNLYNAGLYEAIDANDAAKYAKLRADVAASTIDSVPMLLLLVDANYYGGIQDWKKLSSALKKLDKTGKKMDAFFYNNAAWAIYETEGSKSQLKQGLQWVDLSLSLEDNYLTWDTKSHVLYALGRKEEAIVAGQKSMDLAKALGDPNEETQAWLDEIQAK